MQRDLSKSLKIWKARDQRSPLILQGARQVGKTYLLEAFGMQEFETYFIFNFERDPLLSDLFSGSLEPKRVIEKLSLYCGQKIIPGKTLVVFDEIQKCPEALTSLKYFQEQMPELHVIGSGSLLGVKIGRASSFPVGKVQFLKLYPMSFLEFLDAVGKSPLRHFLEEKKDLAPIELPFHEELLHLLKIYFVVGGMPAAVQAFINEGDPAAARKVQSEILEAYEHDFVKYASAEESLKILRIWKSIPAQIARENKKFKLKDAHQGARYREYSVALEWLLSAGVVLRSTLVSLPHLPLSAYADEKSFKLYFLDIGLLGALIGISPKAIIEKDRLFSEYNGAFTENYVAQELKPRLTGSLHYWASSNQAEVDFLVTNEEAILPLEVKAGVSRQKKSLLVYGQKYPESALNRATQLNFKKDGRIRNFPLYAVFKLFEQER